MPPNICGCFSPAHDYRTVLVRPSNQPSVFVCTEGVRKTLAQYALPHGRISTVPDVRFECVQNHLFSDTGQVLPVVAWATLTGLTTLTIDDLGTGVGIDLVHVDRVDHLDQPDQANRFMVRADPDARRALAQ